MTSPSPPHIEGFDHSTDLLGDSLRPATPGSQKGAAIQATAAATGPVVAAASPVTAAHSDEDSITEDPITEAGSPREEAGEVCDSDRPRLPIQRVWATVAIKPSQSTPRANMASQKTRRDVPEDEIARIQHQRLLNKMETAYHQIKAALHNFQNSNLAAEVRQGVRAQDDPQVNGFWEQMKAKIATIPNLQVQARLQHIVFGRCDPRLAHLSVLDENGQMPKDQARPWMPYPDLDNRAESSFDESANVFVPPRDSDIPGYIHPSHNIENLAQQSGVKGNTVEGLLRGKAELASREPGYPNSELESIVHSTNTAANILESLRANLPTTVQPLAFAPPVNNPKPIPADPELAIDHIKAANPDSEDVEEHCTFCTFDCDYGIYNDRVLLPQEASKGYCVSCKRGTTSFMENYSDLYELGGDYYDTIRGFEQEHQFQHSHDLEEVAHDATNVESAAKYQICQPTAHNTTSSLDGQDISRFRGIMFCRGSSMTQVDVTKARICEKCKDEKLAIMHHRHREFGPTAPGSNTTPKDKRCMLCTGMAEEACDGCPLKVCFICAIRVKKDGKGWTNNAIYSFGRDHMRNDAFLLRSDGGGY